MARERECVFAMTGAVTRASLWAIEVEVYPERVSDRELVRETAREVKCPRCGAEISEPCRGRRRPRISVHQARLDAAARIGREDPIQVAALRALPYMAYLRSAHWQLVRAAALRSAKGRCRLCGTAGRLAVHHRSYENIGRETASDVIALCFDCHDAHHQRMAAADAECARAHDLPTR